MFSTKPYIDVAKLTDWNRDFDLGLDTKTVSKGEIFLKEGQKCDHLYYLQNGFIRVYYLDLQGNEVTHWFCGKDAMITSPFSFLKEEKNILFFEALEDSEMVLVSRNQQQKLIEALPKLGQSFRHINAEFAMVLSRRIMSIHTETAEERYLNLMKEHPLLFQKAKLSHIASFLGITQQSLSRIRKNL